MRATAQFGRGVLYGVLLDIAAIVLFWLLSGWSLAPWVLVLLWAMAVVGVTGAALMEARWLVVGGFWLVHGALFTLGLWIMMAALKLFSESRGLP